MELWLFISIVAIATIVINIMGSATVLKSQLYTEKKQFFYLILIWSIPIFGLIATTLLVSHEMKNIKTKNNEQLIATLNDFGKKINSISESIKKKHENKTKQ